MLITIFSGNALVSINVVALRLAWLVLVYHSRCLTKTPMTTQPQWVGAMSIDDGLGEFCVTAL